MKNSVLKDASIHEDQFISVRSRIDAIDDALLALLSERTWLVEAVMAAREEMSLPLVDPVRERQIINRLTKQSDDSKIHSLIPKVWSAIFRAMRGDFP